MDEFTPENLWKRRRTSSFNPRATFSNSSQSVHSEPVSERPTNITVIEQVQVPPILSPTPRRHLLESSANQHWLNSPALSVSSSRPSSPQLTSVNNQPAASLIRHRFNAYHPNFSSLYEREPQGAFVNAGSDKLHRGEPEGTAMHMGRRWIRWMHKRGIKEWVIPGVIVASTLVKFLIGLGSYSGQSTPPMFGDYEAQRHWMELTIHLPFRQWYTYDLSYWGLDYPPLSAYVSWICGILSVYSILVELGDSLD
jgi:alpha-1,3-glucosyltransferase